MGVCQGAGRDYLIALAGSHHEAAFADYEAVRTRWLPPPIRSGHPVELGIPADLADLFDVQVRHRFEELPEPQPSRARAETPPR
jgi:hypothetical protein